MLLTTRDLEPGSTRMATALAGRQRDDNPIRSVTRGAPRKAPERRHGDNVSAVLRKGTARGIEYPVAHRHSASSAARGDGPLEERKRETVPNGGKPMGNRLIVLGDGPPCPTCGRSTQIREHRQITADLVAKPYYFRRWFCCVNRRCKTKLIMRDEFKVAANNGRVAGGKKYTV